MIVVMAIDGEGARRFRAEQASIVGMLGHRLRHARAADVTVETDDAVGVRHDDVQVVGHEQNAEAGLVAQAGDQLVELRLARVVDALHRLVEDQQVGPAQQRARQQHTLQLAAGQLAELLMADGFGVDVSENLGDGIGAGAAPQHQEALNRHRDDGVDVEALRHIADAQILATMHRAAIGLLEAQQHAHQRRLAGAVEPDERDDLALADVEVDVQQEVAAVARDANAARRDQRRRIDLRGRLPMPVLMRAGMPIVVATRLRRGRHSIALRHRGLNPS